MPAGVLPRGRGVVAFGTAGLVNAIGTGFFYPYSLIFFQQSTGLALGVVGAALTVSRLAALPVLRAVGEAADRFGPRTVLIAAALARAGCFLAFIRFGGLAPLLVFATVLALGNRAEQVATQLVAVEVAPPGQAPQWVALTRIVSNAGIGSGGLLAGVLIAGQSVSYVGLGLVNALSFVAVVPLYLAMPARVRREPRRRPDVGHEGKPWRDLPFMRVALVNALLMLSALALESGAPVYIVRDTSLAAWTVGLLLAVNASLVTLLPLPAAGLVDRLPPVRVLALGSLCYLPICGALILAGRVGGGTLPLLIGGMIVYSAGEIGIGQAASVMLATRPPEAFRGRYLAFNQTLVGVATAAAPLVTTQALGMGPTVLWWVLAGLSVAALVALRVPGRDLARVGASTPAT